MRRRCKRQGWQEHHWGLIIERKSCQKCQKCLLLVFLQLFIDSSICVLPNHGKKRALPINNPKAQQPENNLYYDLNLND